MNETQIAIDCDEARLEQYHRCVEPGQSAMVCCGGYAIAQEKSVGVRPNDFKHGKHHAFNFSTSEIIYSGSFEDCVRAIDRQLRADKMKPSDFKEV